ncbi:MAG: inositol-3-phosphate synthase [Thermodesulfobacteriota bacterium]
MTSSSDTSRSPLLLMVAGAKGAIASTLAVAVTSLRHDPRLVLPSLTTAEKFPFIGPPQVLRMVGWDQGRKSLLESLKGHGVLSENIWKPHESELEKMGIEEAPDSSLDLKSQIKKVVEDIQGFQNRYPDSRPVFVNLLPAAIRQDLSLCKTQHQLHSELDPKTFPDMAYILAAIQCGLPVINFTPNEVEIPVVLKEVTERALPLCGRDGKTGQTYLKVVLASALKARRLFIDGWYSLNILGNADGENLAEPGKAEGKLLNKTELLDDLLGYRVGERYQTATHKVLIDYYPPRGDAKEAWDVIDFLGLFGLPMSLRLNLQGRDSILAAPMVLDLARWMAALHLAGKKGPIPELGFFFKKPVGNAPALTFQDQLHSLDELERTCESDFARKNPSL